MLIPASSFPSVPTFCREDKDKIEISTLKDLTFNMNIQRQIVFSYSEVC